MCVCVFRHEFRVFDLFVFVGRPPCLWTVGGSDPLHVNTRDFMQGGNNSDVTQKQRQKALECVCAQVEEDQTENT